MTKNEKLMVKFIESGGILKTFDLVAQGFDYRSIQKLIANEIIEKIKNGYYKLTDVKNNMSEAQLISKLFPDGVLCMYSALFYYGYSDRTPLDWDIAIGKNTSKSRFNIEYPYIKPYYTEEEVLSYGIATAQFPDCTMRIFNRDRLICECIRFEKKMDRESFNKAIQGYIADPQKNISKLIEYSKKRNIAKKVKMIIGVWL
jgi:predicted transcriptional regulator of viral defense system